MRSVLSRLRRLNMRVLAQKDNTAAFVVVQSTARVGASVVRQLMSQPEVGFLTDASDPETYSIGGSMGSEKRELL